MLFVQIAGTLPHRIGSIGAEAPPTKAMNPWKFGVALKASPDGSRRFPAPPHLCARSVASGCLHSSRDR
ncbi:hypothetical protein [Lysobacter gummosus]|uniref:hypothetical protein n=1 Tax=Lysobacter TaxID=68 RepID=UPI003CCE155F